MAEVELASSVIGLVGDVLGLVGSVASDYPGPSGYKSTVRVGVGMSDNRDDAASLGGDAPGAAIWADDGSKLGYTEPPGNKIQPSGYSDIVIDQKDDSAYPTYVVVAAGGNDAICINYVTLTDSQQNNHAWLGDIGYQCGAPWYHSTSRFGPDQHVSRCTWIDGDGSNDIVEYAMGMHIVDFSNKTAPKGLVKEYQDNSATMCGTKPRWAMYPKKWSLEHDNYPAYDPILEYNADGSDEDVSKIWQAGKTTDGNTGPNGIPLNPVVSSTRHRRGLNNTSTLKGSMQTHPNSIIISNFPSHSINELCNHPKSKGPSMVNLVEGLFCDMATKKIWPTCSESVTCGCLDIGNAGFPGNGTMDPNNGATRYAPSNGTVGHSIGFKPYTRPACGKSRISSNGAQGLAMDKDVEAPQSAGKSERLTFKNVIDWTK